MNQLASNATIPNSQPSSWATGKVKYLVLVVAACLALLTLGAPLGASSADAAVPIPRYADTDELDFGGWGLYRGTIINDDGDVPDGYNVCFRWFDDEYGWFCKIGQSNNNNRGSKGRD